MNKKNKHNLKKLLICIACAIPVTGCSQKTTITEPVMQTEAAKADHEAQIVRLIEQGRQEFLYPMQDGYSYPVKVLKPEFIETMPLKIKVRLRHQQRDIAVTVNKLQTSRILPAKTAPVEVRLGDKWQPLDHADIRIKTTGGDDK